VLIQLAVTASSNSLKFVILYITMFKLVPLSLFLSLSLSLSHTHTHTHTHTHNDYHLLEVNYPLLYTACDFTTLLGSSYFCDFQQSGPNYFSAEFLIFNLRKAATVLLERRENP
jgi:hypothetical protein